MWLVVTICPKGVSYIYNTATFLFVQTTDSAEFLWFHTEHILVLFEQSFWHREQVRVTFYTNGAEHPAQGCTPAVPLSPETPCPKSTASMRVKFYTNGAEHPAQGCTPAVPLSRDAVSSVFMFPKVLVLLAVVSSKDGLSVKCPPKHINWCAVAWILKPVTRSGKPR